MHQLLICAVLLLAAGSVRAQLAGPIAVSSSRERPSEVALTLAAEVSVSDLDALQRCLARPDRTLSRHAEPAQVFRGIRWIPSELEVLRECSVASCKYELPAAAVRRLQAARAIEAKQHTYLRLVQELTAGADKARKPGRVRRADVTERCAGHGGFAWLLDGELTPDSPLSWRRVGGQGRMQPTMMTFQAHTWKVGDSRCAGRTLLFADHYYRDHLELLEVTPLRQGRATVRYHVRSRYDFLTSWWKRKAFKWRIRSAMEQESSRLLRKWIKGCLPAGAAAPPPS